MSDASDSARARIRAYAMRYQGESADKSVEALALMREASRLEFMADCFPDESVIDLIEVLEDGEALDALPNLTSSGGVS